MDARGEKQLVWTCDSYIHLFCTYYRGEVSGRVTAGGTGLPNVSVTVTTHPTGDVQTGVTQQDGWFFIPVWPEPDRTWTASFSGNETYVGSSASGEFVFTTRATCPVICP